MNLLLHVLLFLQFAARSNVFCAILQLTGYPNVRMCTGAEDPEGINFANPAHSFRFVRRVYKGCTHVMGSVVLSNLYGDLDLSFLNTIVEIGGSLIITNNRNVRLISFEKLAIIRGEVPYTIMRSKREYKLSLYISHNVMKEAQGIISLPSLTAVKKHGIDISNNNNGYCHLQNVYWKGLMEVNNMDVHSQLKSCNCASIQCNSSSTSLLRRKQSTLCHSRRSCDPLSRCYRNSSGKERCCHKECAGGCSGKSPSDCFACKNQRLGSECRAACSEETTFNPEFEASMTNPDHSVAFSGFCVKQCPKFYLEDNGQCVAHCTPGQSYYRFGETRCLACEPGVAACQHCQQRKLEEDLLLRKPSILTHMKYRSMYDKKMKRMIFTPRSILVAIKNCKTYDGDIVINTLSERRRGNLEEHVRLEDFENLKNLEHLNGQLSLNLRKYPTVQNLTFLSNLKSINSPRRGLQYVMGPAVEYLGLQSLKSVNVKNVQVVVSPKLCYMENFKERFNSDTKVTSLLLKDAKKCKNEGKVCDASCSSKGCWGPGPSMCV